jgi:hypothetical protein
VGGGDTGKAAQICPVGFTPFADRQQFHGDQVANTGHRYPFHRRHVQQLGTRGDLGFNP